MYGLTALSPAAVIFLLMHWSSFFRVTGAHPLTICIIHLMYMCGVSTLYLNAHRECERDNGVEGTLGTPSWDNTWKALTAWHPTSARSSVLPMHDHYQPPWLIILFQNSHYLLVCIWHSHDLVQVILTVNFMFLSWSVYYNYQVKTTLFTCIHWFLKFVEMEWVHTPLAGCHILG